MKKERLYLEFPLATTSLGLVWKFLSTDHGLERWIADRVVEENGVISLTWGNLFAEHHTLHARIVERAPQSHLKLQWVDEDDPEAYWEMRLSSSELDGQVTMQVTDYAPADELDDLAGLWDGNLERLHNVSGL